MIVNNNNYVNNKFKVMATLGVAWDRTVATKQTLFAVWGDKEEKRARKGSPEEFKQTEYTLRATKGVNMHPFPMIQLIHQEDGSRYTEEEEIKISIVSANDKMPPVVGSCTCGGSAILTESKPFQLLKRKGEMYCKIRGGTIEFTKLQIGCCTSGRGHGSPFCLKAEFTKENSPLKGRVIYSIPIEVGAKGPFAKIFCNNASSNSNVITALSTKRPATCDLKYLQQANASYDGAEEMVNLLVQLNLQKYIPLFLEHEVDLQAFLQLSDSDFKEMGIEKVGPRVKILKEIERLKEEWNRSNRSLPSLPSDDNVQWTTLENILQDDSILDQQSCNNNSKRRKLIETVPNGMPRVPSFDGISLHKVPSFDGISLSRVPSIESSLSRIPSIESSLSRIGSVNSFEDWTKLLSIYIYLSHITATKNKLNKTLFVVKSSKTRKETEETIQRIQQQIFATHAQQGDMVYPSATIDGKTLPAQLMVMMQPDKNGGWVANTQYTQQIWNFRKGDYIKIDNRHTVDVGIIVHYFMIPDNTDGIGEMFVEDARSPKRYPVLFPGSSLEIGVDDNKEGRLSIAAELDSEPFETFAVSCNGKIVPHASLAPAESCVFSFKRRKENMKKVDSLDDFQKELFLAKCLEIHP